MSLPTTLAQAISDVREYINDRQGRRWSDANVKRALHSAISSCLEEYAHRGGDRFDEETTIETSEGSASMLTLDPVTIRFVLLSLSSGGSWSTPLQPADPEQRGVDDSSDRTLLVRFVRRPKPPETDDDILIGATLGAARPWLAFERWVCMCAALELGITDDDARASLLRAEQRKREEVLSTGVIPKKLPWPRETSRRLFSDIRWVFVHRTATLSLHQVRV